MSENQVVDAPKKTALQKFGEKVDAIPLWGKVLIVVLCCALDSVTCVLLLVGSIVFMKAGNKGLALVLALCNIVCPDSLPFVDEIFTIIVTVIPLYKEFKATGNVLEAVKASFTSRQEYKGMSADAMEGTLPSITIGNDDEYMEDTYEDTKSTLIADSGDVTSTIKELNQMKLDGIITEEEFNQKKSDLLSKL